MRKKSESIVRRRTQGFERPDYSVSPVALGFFVLGRVADIYTTYVGISEGFSEGHPVTRCAVDNLGLETGLATVNALAIGTSYILAKGFNWCFRSSLTDKVGDAVFLYGGAMLSFAVALNNQLRICGYFE